MHTENARQAVRDIEAQEQAEFDTETASYRQAQHDTEARDQHAWHLDTQHREAFTLHNKRFDFIAPDWNDTLTETKMWERCGQIADTLLKQDAGTQPTRDTIAHNQELLDFSFSERIKQHIVGLTATTETPEGACKHCFGLYDTDSKTGEIDTPMMLWQTLCNILHPAPVYHAFLERAWHLTPASPYFPDRYRDLVKAVRESETDTHSREQAHYANPYAQLKALVTVTSNPETSSMKLSASCTVISPLLKASLASVPA